MSILRNLGKAIALLIDVSYHQGIIDWVKVKASGMVDAAIIRCGYRGYGTGRIAEDVRVRQNIKGALENNIPIGIYFFSTAISVAEAIEEARWVLRLIKEFNITYPVVFDYEGYKNPEYRSYGKTTKALRTAMCKAFNDTVIAEGYETLVYGSKGLIRSKYDLKELDEVGIWCARYAGGYDKVIDDEKWFPDLGEFTGNIELWQYTSIGRIPGIKGRVDMNKVYGDIISDGIESGASPDDDDTGESEAMGTLKSINEAEFFCDVGEYHNGNTREVVFADTACTKRIGSLNPHEKCLALGIFDGRVAVLFTMDGTNTERVGFVKWMDGYKPGGNPYNDYSYQNGNTPEKVYADNEGKIQIGTLFAGTRCDCAAIVDGMALIRYDTAKGEKIGFAKWLKGVVAE